MDKRTKLLAFLALGTAGLLVAGFLIRGLIVGPLHEVDGQIRQYEAKLMSLQRTRNALVNTETQVQAAAAKEFGLNTVVAEAKLGALLTQRLGQVGLHEAQFTRTPVGRHRLYGGEITGWTIQGQGPLKRVLDLLFVLQSDPRLHRIEGLSLSPARQPGRVRVRFSYLTLVFDSAPAVKLMDPVGLVKLNSVARRRYDAITERDLLRPYIPGEEPAAPPIPLTAAQRMEQEEQNLKVVSLSSWDGHPEVHLYDAKDKRLMVRRPGEKLLDGQVVTVDYRPLPIPGAGGLLSYSRLIWRIGNTYWAVDPGQTLAERRRLSSAELPPDLKLNLQTSISP